MTDTALLVSFLTQHGFDRDDVMEHIDAWISRRERMNSLDSFENQIILEERKKKGETLSPSEEEYLNYLNKLLFFID